MSLVSVIIPVYNVEYYVERCLEVALGQTFEDIEYILIDDCSTDRSVEIIREYISKHPRRKKVKLVSHDTNRGIGFVRGEGIQYATGKYVFFLDSDDMIELDCIEKLYQVMKETEVDFVVGSYDKIDFETGEFLGNMILQSRKIVGRDAIVKAFYENAFPLMVWNKLIQTSFLKNHHISCSLPRYEDDVFNFQMICNATSCVILSEVTYHYYIREKSITFRREFDDAYFKIQLEMTNLTREYAKKFQDQAIYSYLSCKLFWQRVFIAESLLYDSNAKIKDKNSFLSSFLRSDISLKEACGFSNNKVVNYLMVILSGMPIWVKKLFLRIHKNMMKN